MGPGETKQCNELVMWQPAKKMHMGQIRAGADLRQQLVFPRSAVLRRSPVRDTCIANDTDVRFRPLSENSPQCPHEDVKAPVWLKVAGNIGYDFIFRSQHAADLRMEERCRSGRDPGRINPIVDHRDLRMVFRRKRTLLPMCRRDGHVAVNQRQKSGCIPQRNPQPAVRPEVGKLRVEADIGAFGRS